MLSDCFITPESTYKQLVDNWHTFKNDNFIGCDRLAINICKVLNQLPGVVTVFSCEGHLKYDSDNNLKVDAPYFMFAAGCEDGVLLINKLFNLVDALIRPKCPDTHHHLKLTLVNRVCPFIKEVFWYPALIISFDISSPSEFSKEKATFLDAMEQAAKTLVTEYSKELEENEPPHEFQNTWIIEKETS